MTEMPVWKMNGFLIFVLILCLLGIAVALFYFFGPAPINLLAISLLTLLALVLLTGLTIVPPNHARVVIFFGKYLGSIRDSGFYFVCPLTGRQKVSLQVRNFKTMQLKVNDSEGSPVEIAAVIVFRVADTEKAVLEVEKYDEFIEIQSKTAIRQVAA